MKSVRGKNGAGGGGKTPGLAGLMLVSYTLHSL